MRFYFICIFILFAAPNTIAQSETASLESFIPNNRKAILQVFGDLNKDAIEDLVVVTEETDLKKRMTNTDLGSDTLNLNPRALLVLFGGKDGKYRLAEKNDSGFIPAENDKDTTCLADPLLIDGGISIKNNILIIEFNYWRSCGSWSEDHKKYSFRYQNQAFELIGFDANSIHRSSGAESTTSINFSTKKIQTTTGGNAFEETKNHPKAKTSSIKYGVLLKLSGCNPDTPELLEEL